MPRAVTVNVAAYFFGVEIMIKAWKYVKANSPVASENTQFNGRYELFTDEQEVTADNIKQIIEDNFFYIYENRQKCLMLKNFIKNLQPVTKRQKKVRSEINNRVVVNHASQIVEFKKGFIFGNPLTYSQRAREDIATDKDNVTEEERNTDTGVANLNEMMFEQDKGAKDLKLADDIFTCGVGYRLALANDDEEDISAFNVYTLPAESTFVIRKNDVTQEAILAGTFIFCDDGSVKLGAYSKDKFFDITMTGVTDDAITVKTMENGIGRIPIIQYRNNNNLMCAFEPVIGIMNAINTVQSDRVNGIAQFIQAILWLNNCKLSDSGIDELSEKGCIQTKDISSEQKANIEWLTSQLDQANTQTVIDDMTQTLLEIAGVPDRETSTGGNTGQAIMLSNGWHTAETQAQAFEELFRQSEREFLRVILSIIKNNTKVKNDEQIKELKISDIYCNFNRNRTDNLLTKTQGLKEMLDAGVHPRLAFSLCGLFSDSEQAYIDSEPYLAKWEYSEPTEDVEKDVQYDDNGEIVDETIVDDEQDSTDNADEQDSQTDGSNTDDNTSYEDQQEKEESKDGQSDNSNSKDSKDEKVDDESSDDEEGQDEPDDEKESKDTESNKEEKEKDEKKPKEKKPKKK